MNLQDIENRLKWLDQTCRYYALGEKMYEIFCETLKDSPDTGMIISPANLGDTVFIATLSKAYKEKHGLKKLLIAAKQRQAEAVQWFEGVDDVLGLEDEEMLYLRVYFTISRNFYSHGIRYGHIPCYVDANYPGTFFHIPPGFEGIPLIRVWEKRILDLPENSPTCNICVPEGVSAKQNAEKYEKAVLIAPAAFTNKGIPESFWKKLTRAILDKGYDVYCNSGGLYYDKIIDGTKELVLGTQELILNAPLFKHVVAVRSGFTDLVVKTSARLSVIHLGGSEGAPIRVEYGSRLDDVRDLGRMEDVFPVVYCAEREDELIQTIMEDGELY